MIGCLGEYAYVGLGGNEVFTDFIGDTLFSLVDYEQLTLQVIDPLAFILSNLPI